LPLSEQTKAAVALLLKQREVEDHAIASERQEAEQLLQRERLEHREKLTGLLVLEGRPRICVLRWSDARPTTR
jgi:hypothetical protein